MKTEAMIFDLDGTLLDTIDDIADSCNAALSQCGFPVHDRDAYFFFVGEGVKVLIDRMVPEGNRDAVTLETVELEFRNEYGRRWNVKTRPFDGVAEMLAELGRREIRMGILSNKPEEFTLKCMQAHLDDWAFDPIMGQRSDTPRKPDPGAALAIAQRWNLSPEQVAFVGDTLTDMETAVNAGMHAIGVTWGFRPEQELRDAGASVIVHTPAEILDAIQQ